MRPLDHRPVVLSVCFGILVLSACRAESPPDNSGAATAAYFKVEYQRGKLALSGHVASAEHGQQLLDLAAARFANVERSATLGVLESVPPHWEDSTRQLVDALAATHSASAVLTAEMLRVRGVAPAEWSGSLAGLRASLPESLPLVTEVIESDITVGTDVLCARAITRFRIGPVYFEESGTTLRSSAFPELERVVALANLCRNVALRITGHTDSSGDETWNQRLSLARAQAVADYLAERGLSAARLKPVGAGSTVPVADNRTRYGRSLNRRIDVQFLAADGNSADSGP